MSNLREDLSGCQVERPKPPIKKRVPTPKIELVPPVKVKRIEVRPTIGRILHKQKKLLEKAMRLNLKLSERIAELEADLELANDHIDSLEQDNYELSLGNKND